MTAPRLVLIVSLLAVAVAGYWHAYNMGKREGVEKTTARWTQERLALKQAQLEEVQRSVQIEHHLTEKIAKIQHEASHEKRRITDQYERTIAGLRNRPEARADTSGVPKGAAAGVEFVAGCTGVQLSGPDSRFLAGEAARADQLRTALATCIAHADAIERKLNASHPASTRP